MTAQDRPPTARLWTLAALACLAWALIAVSFASLAPPTYVPHVFHNYHVEHLVAFYVVTLLSAAALPSIGLTRIGLVLALLAGALGLFRILALVNKVFYAEDLVCDLAGILAAIIPIFVGRFRRIDT
jgi:ABC-type Na+ efflux pump permease subunit